MSEELGLKVRGVALWLKTLRGQSPFVVNEAFETLLLAADALHAKPPEAKPATDVAEAGRQGDPTDRRVRASSAGGEEP